MKSYRLHTIMSTLFIGCMLLLTLYMSYMMFYPFDVCDVRIPSKVINDRVYPGGEVLYEMEYCKYIDVPATVHVRLIDGAMYTLVPFDSHTPVGCGRQVVSQKIPQHTPPGEYHLEFSIEYKISQFRSVFERYETEKFTVTE